MSRNRPRAELLQELVARLREFSDRDVLFSQALAERIGLNLTDFKSASLLDQHGPLTAGKLAELTALTTGAVTGVLDRLEKAGLVRRVKDPSDRRHVIVETVQDQGPRLDALLAGLLTGLEQIAKDFEPAELERISEFLARATALMAEQAAALRQSAPPPASAGSAPRAGLERATLRFSSGASRVTLRADAPPELLYQARFEGREPEVKLAGSTLTIAYPRFMLLDFRKVAAEVSLNAEVAWDVELTGGVSRMRADLGEVRLGRLELRGGASNVEVALPRPRGVVTLKVSGGASQLTLRRPKGVPMRVQVSGGASRLTFDGQQVGAAGGTTRLETPNILEQPDRYELEISGGASQITVAEG